MLSPHARRRVVQITLILVGAWVAVVLALFLLQRKMVFAAPPPLPVPASPQTQHVTFGPSDALVHAVWAPPSDGGPVVVHFHGNAEQLAGQVQMASLYGRRGLGFLAVEYPGYGPMADQEASELALIGAGQAAIDWLRDEKKIGKERIVLQGRSLGSGVATHLAASGAGARLVLISPFLSLVRAASAHYPWVPVGLLLRDRFDNASKATRVTVPALVIHGEDDGIVPFAQGKALAETLPSAELVTVKSAGHNDLLAAGGTEVLGRMMQFALDAVQPAAPGPQ